MITRRRTRMSQKKLAAGVDWTQLDTETGKKRDVALIFKDNAAEPLASYVNKKRIHEQ